MSDLQTILVRCSSRDRPGITSGLLGVLAGSGVDLLDMEQVVVRGRLTLDLLIEASAGDDVLKELLFHGWEHGLQLDFEAVDPGDVDGPPGRQRSVVTVIGQSLPPAALAAVTGAVADAGGNIDRIVRLSRYPVVSYEFTIHDGEPTVVRTRLLEAAGRHGIDVAVQPANLERRAKRLVVIDVDSTLIQDEVVDLLAREAGCEGEVAALTARAMRGEIEFAEALRARVALLAGTPAATLDRIAERVRLTPGARTFVRTLKRLGFTVAIISGGFHPIVDRLADELGIDHAVANRVEIADGVLTGRLEGRVLDRAGKAEELRRIAAAERIPLSQTVAVGDGANDLDMLAVAGLGIAFNAKPSVVEHADTSVSVPYLDAILFLLGIHRSEVEDADAADAGAEAPGIVPTGGTR